MRRRIGCMESGWHVPRVISRFTGLTIRLSMMNTFSIVIGVPSEWK